MNAVLGFIELGALVLAWMILWQFLVKGWTGAHPNLPAAQGLAAIVN
jgi:hypothetical protein